MMETRMMYQEGETGEFKATENVLFLKLGGENMSVHFTIFL